MSSNSLGKIFSFTTWGESHGKAIGCVVDGVPSQITLSENDIQFYLDKRRPGKSKFTTQRQEKDKVEILSGTFEGKTTGHPISLIIHNEDQRSKDYSDIKDKSIKVKEDKSLPEITINKCNIIFNNVGFNYETTEVHRL